MSQFLEMGWEIEERKTMQSDAKHCKADRTHAGYTVQHETPSFARLRLNKIHVAHLSPILRVHGATPCTSTSVNILNSSARLASNIIVLYESYSDPKNPCGTLTSRFEEV